MCSHSLLIREPPSCNWSFTAGVLFSIQGKEMYKKEIYAITHMQVLFCSSICRAHFQNDTVGFSFCRSTCSRYQLERDVSLKDLGSCYLNSSFQHLNIFFWVIKKISWNSAGVRILLKAINTSTSILCKQDIVFNIFGSSSVSMVFP